MNKPLYLKTNDMAKLIGYSGDYLLKNREILFFEGIHYFPKEKRLDWKVAKMIEWVEGNSISDQAKNILDLVS
jgi:predicted AAA+ superfamily ATPase